MSEYGPKARASDPPTAHAAADAILKTKAGSQRHRLWWAFVRAYPAGLTDEEAADWAGVSPHSEYATRCSELRNARVIEATDDQRQGRSGLYREVSVATQAGIECYAKLYPMDRSLF